MKNKTDFVTEWKVSAGFTICLSIHVRNKISQMETATADWGDGCVEQVRFNSNGTRHTFKRAGTYIVSFSDNIEEWSVGMYGARGTRDYLIDVKQWGTAKWRSLSYMFYSAKNMTMSATDAPNCSRGVSAKKMFAYCEKFNSPINHWDVVNINNGWGMLYEAPAFDQDMSNWVDVSNTTNSIGLAENMHIFHYPLEEYQEKFEAKKEKATMLDMLSA